MIENSYFWNNILLLAAGTFAIRGSIIAISSRVPISARTKELFSYIPAAILPAFVAPSTFLHKGQVEWMMGKERTVALILAVVVCFFSRSTLATVASGLIALFAMGYLLR